MNGLCYTVVTRAKIITRREEGGGIEKETERKGKEMVRKKGKGAGVKESSFISSQWRLGLL